MVITATLLSKLRRSMREQEPAIERPTLVKASVIAEELMARLSAEDDEFGCDGTLGVVVRSSGA